MNRGTSGEPARQICGLFSLYDIESSETAGDLVGSFGSLAPPSFFALSPIRRRAHSLFDPRQQMQSSRNNATFHS
jgi:hypothetical protein